MRTLKNYGFVQDTCFSIVTVKRNCKLNLLITKQKSKSGHTLFYAIRKPEAHANIGVIFSLS